jgi:hypothetical protein
MGKISFGFKGVAPAGTIPFACGTRDTGLLKTQKAGAL